MKSLFFIASLIFSSLVYSQSFEVKNFVLEGAPGNGIVSWDSFILKSMIGNIEYDQTSVNYVNSTGSEGFRFNRENGNITVNFDNSQSFFLKETKDVFIDGLNASYNSDEKLFFASLKKAELSLKERSELNNLEFNYKVRKEGNKGTLKLKSASIGGLHINLSDRQNSGVNRITSLWLNLDNNEFYGYFYIKYIFNNKVYVRGKYDVDLKKLKLKIKLTHATIKWISVKWKLINEIRQAGFRNISIEKDVITLSF